MVTEVAKLNKEGTAELTLKSYIITIQLLEFSSVTVPSLLS